MPTRKNNTNFSSTFNSTCRRGASYTTAVNNCGNTTGKSTKSIWNNLCTKGNCTRQKFNGSAVYFPKSWKGKSSTTAKTAQTNCWQWFCEWCLASGTCTPKQLASYCGNQKNFMNFCRRFWNSQFGTSTSTTSSKSRSTTTRSKKRTTSTSKKRSTSTTGYRFPSKTSTWSSWRKVA